MFKSLYLIDTSDYTVKQAKEAKLSFLTASRALAVLGITFMVKEGGREKNKNMPRKNIFVPIGKIMIT